MANVSGGIYGIYAATDWTIDNAGTIAAGSGAGHRGVFLADGGAVTNAASGAISGYDGVRITNAAGTVDNSGTITGNPPASFLAGRFGHQRDGRIDQRLRRRLQR